MLQQRKNSTKPFLPRLYKIYLGLSGTKPDISFEQLEVENIYLLIKRNSKASLESGQQFELEQDN